MLHKSYASAAPYVSERDAVIQNSDAGSIAYVMNLRIKSFIENIYCLLLRSYSRRSDIIFLTIRCRNIRSSA